MSDRDLTVSVAIELLRAVDCDSDPIRILMNGSNFGQGEAAEVGQLDEFQLMLSPHTAKTSPGSVAASKVRLSFCHTGGVEVEGTLRDMVIVRLRQFGGMSRPHWWQTLTYPPAEPARKTAL